MARPLFLLTDFGLNDPFVGIMKAVMLRLSPGSPIVDLTHGIAPQDVVAGAMALEDSLPWLPGDAVVCAVVDPGVGSERRAMAFERGGQAFVGPDNGLLAAAWGVGARTVALRAGPEIAPGRSATFHGRDVFAPAAALLAAGADLMALGDAVNGVVGLDVPSPELLADGSLALTVLAIDRFGNLTLNLRQGELTRYFPAASELCLRVGGRLLPALSRTFGDVARGEPLFYWNAAGRLEVAVNGGDASRVLGLERGGGAVAHRRGASQASSGA